MQPETLKQIQARNYFFYKFINISEFAQFWNKVQANRMQLDLLCYWKFYTCCFDSHTIIDYGKFSTYKQFTKLYHACGFTACTIKNAALRIRSLVQKFQQKHLIQVGFSSREAAKLVPLWPNCDLDFCKNVVSISDWEAALQDFPVLHVAYQVVKACKQRLDSGSA